MRQVFYSITDDSEYNRPFLYSLWPQSISEIGEFSPPNAQHRPTHVSSDPREQKNLILCIRQSSAWNPIQTKHGIILRCRADEQRLVFDRFSQSTILGLVSRPVSRVTHFVLCAFLYIIIRLPWAGTLVGGGGGWWARHVWSLGKKCNRNRRCRWDTKIRAAETHDNNIMAAFFFSFPSNIKRNSAAEYIIILYWWRFRGLSTGLHGNAFRGVFGPIATVVGIAHECFLCKTRSKRI